MDPLSNDVRSGQSTEPRYQWPSPATNVSGSATLLSSFNPFSAGYLGGITLATGDVNDDGTPDIIAAKTAGNVSNVRVFSGVNNSLIQAFQAFGNSFTSGVSVATEDVNGDGHADIVLAQEATTNPTVEILSGADDSVLFDFMITGVSSKFLR